MLFFNFQYLSKSEETADLCLERMELISKYRGCIIFPLKDCGPLTSYRVAQLPSPFPSQARIAKQYKYYQAPSWKSHFQHFSLPQTGWKISSLPKQMHLKNTRSETQLFLTIGYAFTKGLSLGPAHATSQLCCSHICPWCWFLDSNLNPDLLSWLMAWPQTQLIAMDELGNHWMVCDAIKLSKPNSYFVVTVWHCCYGLDRCQHQHCSVQSDIGGQVPCRWVCCLYLPDNNAQFLPSHFPYECSLHLLLLSEYICNFSSCWKSTTSPMEK